MTKPPFSAADLDALKRWDTPTICNGLELVVPDRRAIGFTVEPMIAVDRNAPPIVGLARTGLIRAKERPRGPIPSREDWYDYVASDNLPTVALLQDIDDRPGYGAFWGEVQSTVHKALGVLGCVTNGSYRDLEMIRARFSDHWRSIGAKPCARPYGPDALRCECLRHACHAWRCRTRRLPWSRRHSRRGCDEAARRYRDRPAPREGNFGYCPRTRFH